MRPLLGPGSNVWARILCCFLWLLWSSGSLCLKSCFVKVLTDFPKSKDCLKWKVRCGTSRIETRLCQVARSKRLCLHQEVLWRSKMVRHQCPWVRLCRQGKISETSFIPKFRDFFAMQIVMGKWFRWTIRSNLPVMEWKRSGRDRVVFVTISDYSSLEHFGIFWHNIFKLMSDIFVVGELWHIKYVVNDQRYHRFATAVQPRILSLRCHQPVKFQRSQGRPGQSAKGRFEVQKMKQYEKQNRNVFLWESIAITGWFNYIIVYVFEREKHIDKTEIFDKVMTSQMSMTSTDFREFPAGPPGPPGSQDRGVWLLGLLGLRQPATVERWEERHIWQGFRLTSIAESSSAPTYFQYLSVLYS